MDSFTMVEERREVMVSPTNGDTIVRKASFLKPIVSSTSTEPPSQLPTYSFPALPHNFNPKEWSLEVSFPGWVTSRVHEAWTSWVDGMASKHHDLWKNVGIYEPIFNSRYQINRDTGLVYGLAEKWCCDTNTFIFQWGEATLTLEDVMVLGGFSALGESIVAISLTPEEEQILKNLDSARKDFNKSTARKPTTSLWMNKFMAVESDYEHEAFLAYWLSRYVLCSTVIEEQAITIAIKLAAGRRVDLASAVLSDLYRDLTLLKLEIANPVTNKVIVKSMFQLVQTWVWERFPSLSPEPRAIDFSVPRLARWDKIKSLKVDSWRRALNSIAEVDFKWRPYTMVHLENEKTVVVGPGLENDLFIFAICIAVRKDGLIGFDSEEIYRPHHVARQFGYDQDLPYCTTLLAGNVPDVLSGKLRLQIPAWNSEKGVSARYSNWWTRSILGNSSPFPPGFPPK